MEAGQKGRALFWLTGMKDLGSHVRPGAKLDSQPLMDTCTECQESNWCRRQFVTG